MKSIDFFNKLIDKCKYIPESKLQKIISFYRNEINTGLSYGQTEDEIINNFGDIDKIISDINTETEVFINTKLNTSINRKIEDNKFIEDNLNKKNNNNVKNINDTNFSKFSKIILKIILFILALAVILPIFTTIMGFTLGILGIFVVILVFSIYVLFSICILHTIPKTPVFLVNFPSNSLLFFSLGLLCLSLFFIILIFYTAKLIILHSIKFYKSEKHIGGSI